MLLILYPHDSPKSRKFCPWARWQATPILTRMEKCKRCPWAC